MKRKSGFRIAAGGIQNDGSCCFLFLTARLKLYQCPLPIL